LRPNPVGRGQQCLRQNGRARVHHLIMAEDVRKGCRARENQWRYATIGHVKSAFLIVNPVSGHGRLQDSRETLLLALRPFARDILITQGAGDAEAAARQAALSGQYEAVLVAGGDGTVNEAVNGLVSARAEGGMQLPLGVVARGTQNVLAHDLNLPQHDLPATIAMLEQGRTRPIDLGRAGDRCFCLMAGFGFDAIVVQNVVPGVKDIFGPGAYALATFQTLAQYQSTSVRLTLDDEEVESEAYLVVVANASSYALAQVKMAPFASIDDGWLDVCVFERAPGDRIGFVTQIMAMFARRHLRDPRVRYYRARRIVIDSHPPIQGQLDGDMFRATPLTIDVMPRALEVFVP